MNRPDGDLNMSAFIVVDVKIKNPEAYDEYKNLAKPIAEKFGGVYRVRGGALDVRQTELWSPTRIVIIEFPDVQSAQAFVESEEYAPVRSMRENNAECTLFIVEG